GGIARLRTAQRAALDVDVAAHAAGVELTADTAEPQIAAHGARLHACVLPRTFQTNAAAHRFQRIVVRRRVHRDIATDRVHAHRAVHASHVDFRTHAADLHPTAGGN